MDRPVLWLCFLVLGTLFVHDGEPLATGAPESTCGTLLPKHRNVVAQKSPSPYTVTAAKPSVAKGDPLRLMITSPEGFSFKGFLLQARAPDSTRAVGTFTSTPAGTKTISCPGGTQNTVTHSDATLKKSVDLEWQPPADFEGDVIFNATVVQDYNTFWSGILTDPVQVVDHSGDDGSHSVGISTTNSPVTTARTTTPVPYTPETERTISVKKDPIYNGCYSTKTCFGDSEGCIEEANCQAVVSCLVEGSNYEFEMKAAGAIYVAVGLSGNNKMGDDSVVECVQLGTGGSNVNAYMSWNGDKPSNSRLPSSDGIQLLNSSYVDGDVYCKFTRQEVTQVNNRTYDLANSMYFLLLVAGSSLKDNGVGYHDILFVPTGEQKFLSDVTGFSPATKLLQKLHGAFMLAAWIGTASIGILLARYFKQTWVGKQLCGKDQWFAWHRMFMVLTWSLTIAGFILIFIEVGGWSNANSIHAILGCITTALAFIQPIGAAFRPHPDSRRRPIFNWLHWLVGNVAHILAIVTIFFAGRLDKAELPSWMLYVLVGYVAFHVCMHLTLSIAGCVSECHNSKRINSFPMKEISNSRSPLQSADRRQDAPHACFRKLMLAIYILGILALTTTFIVVTVLAPIGKTWEKFQRYVSEN